jgi:putative hydrolase of the HAD superfamily
VQAVIFDLFNTLTARSVLPHDKSHTAEILGVSRAAWSSALTQLSGPRLTGQLHEPIEIIRNLASTMNLELAEDVLEAAASSHQRLFSQILMSIPERNVALLKSLRASGLGLALLSNCDRAEIAAWKACPIHGLFDVELFSCDVGLVKPQPEFYEECLRRLGLGAAECLYVGDGGHDELVGARAVGLRTVLYSGEIMHLCPERIPALLPHADFHIESLSVILSMT